MTTEPLEYRPAVTYRRRPDLRYPPPVLTDNRRALWEAVKELRLD